jgi:uncharacterized membrane protein
LVIIIKKQSEYKEQAKLLMADKYKNVILILLVFIFLNGIIAGIFSKEAWISLGSIIDIAIMAGMSFAFVILWRNVVDGKESDLQEILLIGYKENYLRNLVVYLLRMLWVFLFSLLLIIPGIVKAYSYSMAFYVVQKEPKLNPSDALKKSADLMKGHKMDLFKLDLSYLGWYFLGLFTACILWLWIIPKHSTAQMLYYDEIYKASQTENSQILETK